MMLGWRKNILNRYAILQLLLVLFFFSAGTCIKHTLEICCHFDGEKHIHTQLPECNGLHASDTTHHHHETEDLYDHDRKSHHVPCSHEIVQQEYFLLLAKSKFKLNLPICSYFLGNNNDQIQKSLDAYTKRPPATHSHDPPFSLSPRKHFSETIRLVV